MSDIDNPFFSKPKATKRKGSCLLNILQGLAVLSILLVIAYLFVFTPNQVDGFSMFPTFNDKEIVFTNRTVEWLGNTDIGKQLNYNYQHGDVIVFQLTETHELIKRVIGLPGDSISVANGHVIRNGKVLDEKYLDPSVRTAGGDFLQEGDTKIVPDGYLFVMGDNRNNSLDSRFSEIGFLKRDAVKGKVILRLFPLDKFGIIGTGQSTDL